MPLGVAGTAAGRTASVGAELLEGVARVVASVVEETIPVRPNRIASIATIALALSAATPSSAQTDEEKAAARALAQQGAEALQNKKYTEALDYLNRAEAIIHAPPHLLLIGRAYVGLGRLVSARETFLKITREQLDPKAPPAFKRAYEDATNELTAIEPRIGSLRIALTGPGAADASKVTVKLDEQSVTSALIGVHRPIDPGKHVVTANVPGRDPVTQEVTITDGEKKDIALEVQTPTAPTDTSGQGGGGGTQTPTETPKGMSTLRIIGIGGMALGGAGIIAGGVFTGLFFSKKGEANDAFNACPKPCPQAKQDEITALDTAAASRGTAAAVALVAGGVFAGAGVALFILGGKKPAKPTTALVLPFVSPNGLGVVGQF